MKILVTGANGFLGKNFCSHLSEYKNLTVITQNRSDSQDQLSEKILNADIIFHLAGANRPRLDEDFKIDNADFTLKICELIKLNNKKIPIIYSSSIQADNQSLYGVSKHLAEEHLLTLSDQFGVPVIIYRLPNVFGKWSRPNYNSVVATFCYNIARGFPIEIEDEEYELSLVHVDDVIISFMKQIMEINELTETQYISDFPNTRISIGNLAKLLYSFKEFRENITISGVGTHFNRLLYATYLSYQETTSFSIKLKKHDDIRGSFTEVLKTNDSGQFSFFTAHPGVTRGGHYHHIKNEKFIVVKGKAKFRFRNIDTLEYFELEATSDEPEIIETCPGWAHDITNIGNEEMIVLLWANEVFNENEPDTFRYVLD